MAGPLGPPPSTLLLRPRAHADESSCLRTSIRVISATATAIPWAPAVLSSLLVSLSDSGAASVGVCGGGIGDSGRLATCLRSLLAPFA